MHYMRGSRHDFDGWAKEGYQGWSYKDGLPYFIKLEDIQIPSLKNSGINFTIQYEVLKFEKDKKKEDKRNKSTELLLRWSTSVTHYLPMYPTDRWDFYGSILEMFL